jgi:long-subunit fatty acid transport protein
MKTRIFILIAGVGLCCGVANAQTIDANFSQWAWSEEVATPRLAGLGGAAVALTNDSSALPWNPAVLATLTRKEIHASALQSSSLVIDSVSLESSTRLGMAGGGAMITSTIAAGGYLVTPFQRKASLPNGGYQRNAVEEGAGALAVKVHQRLSFGVLIGGAYLHNEGLAEGNGIRVGTGGGGTIMTIKAGTLLDLGKVQLGAAIRPRVEWTATRTSETLDKAGIDLGSEYKIVRPGAYSLGGSWRVEDRARVIGQVDVREKVNLEAGEIAGSTDLRGGIELSMPIKSKASLQIRGGVESRIPATLTNVSAKFYERTRETVGSVGASVVTRKGLTLSASVRFGGAVSAQSMTVGSTVRW